MTFSLDHVVPEPLSEHDLGRSEIWSTDLSIDKGIVQIKASSGKGKSTFIHLLYGNRKDYKGDARIDDMPIKEIKSSKWATLRQKHLSIVYQELLLFPDFTGIENILLKNRLTDYYTENEIRNMAEKVNVDRLLGKKCGTLSFGERQRMAILRALVQPFDWILMDEPFSHLDDENTKLAGELITGECKKQDAGLLLTSLDGHDFISYDRIIQL